MLWRHSERALALSEAAVRIDQEIPQKKPIVLLGRDTWPLLPVLRSRGRDARYFLWSRLQADDKATGKQWLKEVPPGAAVVDTGFAGTVLNAIARVDDSAQGYLLASSGAYPQLLTDFPNHVAAIEGLPKIVGRSSTYTEKGGAVTRQTARDESDISVNESDRANNMRRWSVVADNQAVLKLLGLPDWDVWRYSEYAGLTPRERLGLNTKDELATHEARVRELRAALAE